MEKYTTEDHSPTNSRSYWDFRFDNNWEKRHGPHQTYFFAELVMQYLPLWVKASIINHKMTLCDWGCAEGEAVSLLCQHFQSLTITGIDFSQIAIEHASEKFPALKFSSQDWLDTNSVLPKFDILFSSNTLEHFEDPIFILKNVLSRVAQKYIVLLLPYEEDPHRMDREHLFRFTDSNIPFCWSLWTCVYFKVIDTSSLPDSRWNGKQTLLIYGHNDFLQKEQTVLTLDSLSSCSGLLSEELKRSEIRAEEKITKLENIYRLKLDQIIKLEESLSQVQQEKSALKKELMAISDWATDLNSQLAAIKVSRSWLITQPLRLITRIIRFLRDKRRVIAKMRTIYRHIPLPNRIKQLLRYCFYQFFKFTPPSLPQSPIVSKPQTIINLQAQQHNRPDYFIFGVIDWHFRIQRPQHLAEEIANQGHRVFYFSPHFINDEGPGYYVEVINDSGYLFQIQLYAHKSPIIYTDTPSQEILLQLQRGLGSLLSHTNSHKVISLIQHSFWYPLACTLPNSRLIYDCMDHHDGFNNDAPGILTLEHQLMRNAELIIVTSSWLTEVAEIHNKQVKIIRNACEYDHFCQKPETTYEDPSQRKIIGYYGAIADWFDIELVEKIATQFTDHLVLLVGDDTCGAGKYFKKFSNVSLTGEVSYSNLPFYLYSFDVCLLPFRIMPLTQATNPVKVYEYLSAGKSIVAVDLPEMNQFKGLIHTASTQDEFLTMVANCLEYPANDANIAQRKAFAKNQTWQHRATQLTEAVLMIAEPLVSIIVVTYNNLALTKNCLYSIEAYSDYSNIEIIVVDNASTDGTANYLNQWKNKKPAQYKIILNDSNRGFAAANNQGMKISQGEFLVLLNNDTYVTPTWLRTMVNHLHHNHNIGLLGPVTNNIGNEAKIDIEYDDMPSMHQRAKQYTLQHIGKLCPIRTVAFFCAMIPRHSYDAVGNLDEQFGIGFFEDDDYCRKIEQAGYHIMYAEDVFIHHHLSASFDKMHQKERKQLFDRNKAIYEKKWGTWIPHSHR